MYSSVREEKKEQKEFRESAQVFKVKYNYSIYYKQPKENQLALVFAFSCTHRG